MFYILLRISARMFHSCHISFVVVFPHRTLGFRLKKTNIKKKLMLVLIRSSLQSFYLEHAFIEKAANFLARLHEVHSYCSHHGRPRSRSRSSVVTINMQVFHEFIS